MADRPIEDIIASARRTLDLPETTDTMQQAWRMTCIAGEVSALIRAISAQKAEIERLTNKMIALDLERAGHWNEARQLKMDLVARNAANSELREERDRFRDAAKQEKSDE